MSLRQLFHPSTSIQRLLVKLVAVFLLVLLLVCGLLYLIGIQQQRAETLQEMSNYAEITASHLQLQLQDILDMQTEFQLDTFLQNYTSEHFSTSLYEYRDFSKRILERGSYNAIVDTLDVYVGSKKMVFTSDLGPTSYLDERTEAYFESVFETIQKPTWTREYRQNLYYWLPRVYDHITILMPIPSKYTGDTVAFAAVSIRKSVLDHLLNFGEGIQAYLVDEQGNVLAANTDAPIPEDSYRYLKGTQPVQEFGWQVLYLCPASNLDMTGNWMFVCMILIVLLSVVALWLMAMQMLRSIDQRIMPLTKLMESARLGETRDMPVENTHDEFEYLYDHFNSMMDSIDRQADEIYRLKLLEQEARLKLMQAQIDPHFIYNIFNNMGWMLELKRYDQLHELIDATATFFRKSLNEGIEMIYVGEEKEKLESYIRIQQIRFGDRIRFRSEFDPEILDEEMLNHLLQPLVENAVIHGIEPKAHSGEIRVSGHRADDDTMEFVVEDDGAGIDAERLEMLRESLKDIRQTSTRQEAFFALRNINARIGLYYGEQYGLKIESEPDRGTRVLLRLPRSRNNG